MSSSLIKLLNISLTFSLYVSYSFILGLANIILTFLGRVKTLLLEFTPLLLKYGVTANVIAPLPREVSATTRGVVNGSNPRFTHSHDAKKLFKSILIITLSLIQTPFRN